MVCWAVKDCKNNHRNKELRWHRFPKSNFKLTERHLNRKGKEKMRVLPAVQVFSRTTAALYRKVHPDKPKQADFIELINDWFDVMNSRTAAQTLTGKKPFGLALDYQIKILDDTQAAILKMRVGKSKALYPFQKGILLSINSMRQLFQDLSTGPLQIKYLLTHRLNQDIAENGFSMIRKTGAYHDSPNAVDFKHRLKLASLSWGGNSLSTSSVQNEDHEPYLTGKMMRALKECSSVSQLPPPDPIAVEIAHGPVTANTLTLENVDNVMNSMGLKQSLEQGGKEYVAGYVASKLSHKYPELKASEEEESALGDHSWVRTLGKGLTVPSFLWTNQCATLDAEFEEYHDYSLRTGKGVIRGFCDALFAKYPDFPEEPLRLYNIKTRTFIRIKKKNRKLAEARQAVAAKRMEKWQAFLKRQGLTQIAVVEEEEDEEQAEGEEMEL